MTPRYCEISSSKLILGKPPRFWRTSKFQKWTYIISLEILCRGLQMLDLRFVRFNYRVTSRLFMRPLVRGFSAHLQPKYRQWRGGGDTCAKTATRRHFRTLQWPFPLLYAHGQWHYVPQHHKTYIYIYMYMRVCVCVCGDKNENTHYRRVHKRNEWKKKKKYDNILLYCRWFVEIGTMCMCV